MNKIISFLIIFTFIVSSNVFAVTVLKKITNVDCDRKETLLEDFAGGDKFSGDGDTWVADSSSSSDKNDWCGKYCRSNTSTKVVECQIKNLRLAGCATLSRVGGGGGGTPIYDVVVEKGRDGCTRK